MPGKYEVKFRDSNGRKYNGTHEFENHQQAIDHFVKFVKLMGIKMVSLTYLVPPRHRDGIELWQSYTTSKSWPWQMRELAEREMAMRNPTRDF